MLYIYISLLLFSFFLEAYTSPCVSVLKNLFISLVSRLPFMKLRNFVDQNQCHKHFVMIIIVQRNSMDGNFAKKEKCCTYIQTLHKGNHFICFGTEGAFI